MSAWDWEFFWDIFPDVWGGMVITIEATLLGITIATVLGLFLALGRRSKRRLVRWPVISVIEFIRSTPLLIQLFFLFFALPTVTFLPRVIRVQSPFITLVAGLALHYGTYASEAYRAAIDSVPRGQWEASIALNLSSGTTWRSVILPQAWPRVLPPLGNFFVAMFKDAPLGSAIGVAGVLFVAKTQIGSQTFRFVEPMTIAGILFLAASIPAALFVRYLERRYEYTT